MTPMPDTFDAYVARILAATGITAEQARAVAAGTQPAPGPVADALRDGYHAPDRAPQPRPTSEGDTP